MAGITAKIKLNHKGGRYDYFTGYHNFYGLSENELGKKNTVKNYGLFLDKLKAHFGDYNVQSITPDHILQFLIHETEGQKPATKCFKYTLLKNLFNFLKNSADPSLANPCETHILKKSFRLPKGRQWAILEKDVVDEIIFCG